MKNKKITKNIILIVVASLIISGLCSGLFLLLFTKGPAIAEWYYKENTISRFNNNKEEFEVLQNAVSCDELPEGYETLGISTIETGNCKGASCENEINYIDFIYGYAENYITGHFEGYGIRYYIDEEEKKSCSKSSGCIIIEGNWAYFREP